MIEVYVKGNEDYESNGDMTLTPTTCEVELTVRNSRAYLRTSYRRPGTLGIPGK